MSRGAGRLQRAVVEELRSAAGCSLNRRELEKVFVAERGYDRSNLLRALRGLQSMRLVTLREGPSLEGSVVSLVQTAKHLDESAVFRVLAEASKANVGGWR
jgi:hypothetical protein